MSEQIIHIIYDNNEKIRLDKFLTMKDADHSRSFFQNLIEDEKILVNGRVVKANFMLSCDDEIMITSERQKEALMLARTSIQKVEESIALSMPEDFFSIDLMDAYTMLGTIIGEEVDEDLINKIFKEFCMGK